MILWNCVVTALVVMPLALAGGVPSLPHTVDGWLVILATAFGCQLLGHGLVIYAIERLPASFTAQALLTPPVLSGTAALLLFGESPSLPQLVGAALVLTGLFLAARHESRRKCPPQRDVGIGPPVHDEICLNRPGSLSEDALGTR
jgi:drug/metabolite transporter (DMT)-like permease